MSEAQMTAVLRHLFDQHFTTAQKQTLQRDAATVEVRLGKYERYSGAAISVVGGNTATPRFIINASSRTLPLANGIPNTSNMAVGATPHKVDLLWLRDVADIATDTQQEIERVMHNLNYYVGTQNAQNAPAWAQAIARHSNRNSLKRNLMEYESVPSEFSALASDVGVFRETLSHFFTFTHVGAHYDRWQGASRVVPTGLSAPYKQHNILEQQLRRDEVYVYAVVPTRWLDPQAPAGASRLREVVWGVRWGNDERTTVEGVDVIHTVAADDDAGDYFDFVCFEAVDGVGVAMPVEARRAVDPQLAEFLQLMPEDPAERTAYLNASSHVVSGDTPLVRLLARTSGDTTWPTGVTSAALGDVHVLLSPIDKIMPMAALATVTELRLGRDVELSLSDVRTRVNLAALEARVAAAKRGGEGVVVGVIDTGVDGNHAAFGNRVLAVWDHNDTAGPTPLGRSSLTNFAGNILFNTGTEYTGTTGAKAISAARDNGYHGTHVAGIAAGEAVTGAHPVPAGMAPKAKIVAVELRQPSRGSPSLLFSEFDIALAILYIRQKANEFNANAPVVINMSFGGHDHAHDGTSLLSRFVTNAARVNFSTTGAFAPGVVITAASGNERGAGMHAATNVPAAGRGHLEFTFRPPVITATGANLRTAELLTMWISNPGTASFIPGLLARACRPGTGVTTGYVFQWINTNPWTFSLWGQGAHVIMALGPNDPVNNDANLRVLFRTARAGIPDTTPAGTVTIGGNTYRPVPMNLSSRILQGASWVPLSSVAGAIPLPLTGRWRVELVNGGTRALQIHTWRLLGNVTLTGATETHLVGSPGDAEGVITVASMNSQGTLPGGGSADSNAVGAMSSFSSPGPLRDSTDTGVDITAPGCVITAARSAWHLANRATAGSSVNNNAIAISGTSMASPATAGVIANILAEEPRLTVTDIRTRLRRCSIPSGLPAGTPATANDWGQGMLDANLLKP